MTGIKLKTIANILGVFAVFAFVSVPTMSIADASNPAATRMKAKAKPKARVRKRVVRAKVMKPAPVQEAVITEPAAMPMPEPAPAPQVVEAPASVPTSAPAAAPLAVAKSGGSGWLLGVLGAAAVVAGVVVLADGNDKPASS